MRMRSTIVKKVAAVGLGAAVVGGGMVAVQNASNAADGKTYKIGLNDGVRNWCVDGNLARYDKPGMLFAHPCKKSIFQLWRQVGNADGRDPSEGAQFRVEGNKKNGQKTVQCLDNNSQGDAYVHDCNEGANQKWQVLEGTLPPSNKQRWLIKSVGTHRCLQVMPASRMYDWPDVRAEPCNNEVDGQRWSVKSSL
jgi:Cytolethal distending toxin A/C domain